MLSSCCKVSALTSMLAFSPVIIHSFKYVKVLVFQGATDAEKHLGGNAKKYKFLTACACRYYIKLKRLYCLIMKVSPFTFFPMQMFLHAHFIRFM